MTNKSPPGGVPPALAEQVLRSENRLPARLFGEGFSEEKRKETTLTQYVRDLETWHPAQAAMLVCGLKPALDCTEIPSSGVMGLDNRRIQESWPRFSDARKVLAMWNSRPDAPPRVKPAEFVSWCATKGINTDWLREEVPVDGTPPRRHGNAGAKGALQGRHDEIVRRARAGETQTALAHEFGVSRSAIGKVVTKAKKHSSTRSDPFNRNAR
ncbi:protein of unknown function [Ralstonia solanacearum CMR15]|nr:protein of unknown function [Ralstonia solanacearum CMR15]